MNGMYFLIQKMEPFVLKRISVVLVKAPEILMDLSKNGEQQPRELF